MHIETLHVFGRDYPDERPWELLLWCRHHGATEFTVDGILTEGGSRATFETFDAIADAHRIPGADRYDLHAGALRTTELWSLNEESERALRVAFPGGYFRYVPDDAWFENLSVYRANGDLLLGVITHEAEGVLRVTPAERADLDRHGFPYHLEGEWIGFNEVI